MDRIFDFENKQDREKLAKLVKRFKPIKIKKDDKAKKITGRITQVIKPNELIIKTKRGKYIPLVVENGSCDVIFDYYDTTTVVVKDSFGDEHTLDITYDVTFLVGDAKDFTFGNDTYKCIAYELISFWGLER